MSSTINIFKSAFNSDCETVIIEKSQKIKDAIKLDFPNCLISVNGKKVDENYILQNEDIVTIRQFPSDDAKTGLSVFSWIVDPVGSLITGIATGDWDGGLVHAGKEYIKELFEQSDSSSTSGDTESIPTISGAKNQSGKDKVIPLLIGESMYTPIFCAQAYTDIDPKDGSDGENQYFHALYCLGYNDIDLRSVSLGIYPLSTDRQNGTSKASLDCNNYESKYYNQTIKCDYNETLYRGSLTFSYDNSKISKITISLPIKNSNYDIQSFNSIVSNNISLYLWCKLKTNSQGKAKVGCTINSVSLSGRYIQIVATPSSKTQYAKSNLFYSAILTGSAQISCTAKSVKNVIHYDTSKYKQQLELRQNGEEVDLFPQKVVQETFNTELLHPEGADALVCQPFSAKYPQKVQIEIQFQNLIKYDDKGNKQDNEVTLCVGYSLDGGTTYKPFTAFSASNSKISIKDNGNGSFSDGSGTYKKTLFKGQKNKTMRFVAEKTFTYSEVFDVAKNNVVEFKIWRDGEDKSESDSKLQYKVYLSAIRTWCYDYDKSKDAGELIAQKPLAEKYMKMTARLGFKIKSGDELNGQIDEINVVMCSRARYCTITEDDDGEKTYTWSSDKIDTNNPASLALMVLQHPMRCEYAYTDEQLDLVSFGKFYEWCNQTDSELSNSERRKYTANGVLSKEMKTFDLVNEILAVGHGKLVMNGNKYGVWFDHPQDTPVMILNNQNVLEANNSKAFNEEIDGYSAKFVDCLNDYQEDTQICVPKDTTKDESEYKLENLEVPWITDIARVYRHCMYNLACRKLRPEIWNRKVGVDGNLIEIGSLVLLQDDTLSVGIGDGAEIKEVISSGNYITSIKVDYPFTVSDVSQTYGIKIQHADSTNGVQVRTYELSAFSKTGEYTELTFADSGISLDETVVPNIGDIVAFGLFESITTTATCFEKQEQGDGIFQLKLVPYQEDVYSAEYGTIPEFKSNVTSPKFNGSTVAEEIPSPTYDDISSISQSINDESSEILNLKVAPDVPQISAVTEQSGIRIKCSVNGNLLNNSIKQYIVMLYKGSNDTAGTRLTFSGSEYFYYFDRDEDGYLEADELKQWTVKAKALNFYELESEYSEVFTVNTSKYGTWKFTFTTSNIKKEVMDRTVLLNLSVTKSTSDNLQLYGDTKFKISIKRNGYVIDGDSGEETTTSIADSEYYAPNLIAPAYPSGTTDGNDYKGNEDNYKDESNKNGYVVSNSAFSQTLPLYGQEEYVLENSSWVKSEKRIQNTEYLYKITAYNESGWEVTITDYAVTALCTSIVDIVYSHDYYKNLYVKKISAINANLGLISQGGFGDFTKWSNFWALSNLTEEESGVSGGIKKGAFLVGDKEQYIAVIPPNTTFGKGDNEIINDSSTDYLIKIKAGNIELTNKFTEMSVGTIITNSSNPNERMALRSSGIDIQKYNTETSNWETIGSFTCDTFGNLIITNGADSDDIPKYKIPLSDSAIIYNLENSILDTNGTNKGNFTFYDIDGNKIDSSIDINDFEISDWVYGGYYLLKGKAKKALENQDVCFMTNSDIGIGDSILNMETNNIENLASEWNTKLGVTVFKLEGNE